ncbi:hypothetical protein ACJX0J_034179, partial [Zea mays]
PANRCFRTMVVDDFGRDNLLANVYVAIFELFITGLFTGWIETYRNSTTFDHDLENNA